MDLGDLLATEGIIAALKVKSKKQALQELAVRAAAATGLDAREVFEGMLQREKLASTGLGRGIAVPHMKSKSLRGIVCLFAQLAEPIDFESPDGDPVDLIFVLLAPEHASGDHLKALARISRVVRDASLIERLRAATTPGELRAVLTSPAASHAA